MVLKNSPVLVGMAMRKICLRIEPSVSDSFIDYYPAFFAIACFYDIMFHILFQQMEVFMKPETKFAFRQSIPVMIGYLFFGLAFGLMLQNAGYNFLWALLISSVVYAGSMQYVLVTILSGGLSLISTAVMTLTINSRHFFYGLSFLKSFREMGKSYLYMIFSLTDETYALLCSTQVQEHQDKKKVFFRIALFNQLYWITGSVLGAAFGEILKFNLTGIEFTMTALFTVIFIEQWLAARLTTRIPALIGLGSGAASLLVFGPERFILPALILTVGILLALRPRLIKIISDKEVMAE